MKSKKKNKHLFPLVDLNEDQSVITQKAKVCLEKDRDQLKSGSQSGYLVCMCIHVFTPALKVWTKGGYELEMFV